MKPITKRRRTRTKSPPALKVESAFEILKPWRRHVRLSFMSVVSHFKEKE
jgi:hypothetical protein